MMKKQVVITNYQNKILTALYENDQLAELWLEENEQEVRVGDVYIGKVKNIVPNIQAAFVEIKKGVMGYYSLNAHTAHHFVNVKKNEKLVAGDEIIVRVEKENLKTKAWTLTSSLSYPGRFLVLNTGAPYLMISSKIKSEEERARLKEIVASSPYANYRWMIRTEANGCDANMLLDEMEKLAAYHQHLISTAKTRTCFYKLQSGDTLYRKKVFDLYKESRQNNQKLYTNNVSEADAAAGNNYIVTTDCRAIYQELAHRFEKEEQHLVDLRYYDDESYPLIKLKGLEVQIEKALKKQVWLKSGGYLVIEPTEALTVIDVNTGKAIGKQNMEEHFFKINMEAAKEVLRQLRLRNISGIVIVDFINMKNKENLDKLMQFLREESKNDSVSTTIVDRTALHLVEITRKKLHKTLREQIS